MRSTIRPNIVLKRYVGIVKSCSGYPSRKRCLCRIRVSIISGNAITVCGGSDAGLSSVDFGQL